jgi:hypothetical protein
LIAFLAIGFVFATQDIAGSIAGFAIIKFFGLLILIVIYVRGLVINGIRH